MSVYSRPNRFDNGDRDRDNRRYRENSYSMAHIEFIDGTKRDFKVKAAPTVVSTIARDMTQTGYLTLWNDEETLCVMASQVRSFCLSSLDEA